MVTVTHNSGSGSDSGRIKNEAMEFERDYRMALEVYIYIYIIFHMITYM